MHIFDIKTTKDRAEGKKEERGMTYLTTRHIPNYATVMNSLYSYAQIVSSLCFRTV